LRKEREEGKFKGKGRGWKKMSLMTIFLKRESMCNSLARKKTKKQIVYGYRKLLENVFSPT
jgi:hypothetical protein